MKPIAITTTLLLIAAMAACTHIPIQALQAYTGAYENAREAGLLIYERAGPAFALAAQQDTPSGADVRQSDPLFPETFKRNASPSSQPQVEARIHAMNVVATYNEILLKLATGGSVETIRSDVGLLAQSVTLLVQLAGVSLPFVGTALAPLQGLIALVERARATAAAHEALLTAAPTIHGILKELDKDIDRLYAVQRARYKFEIDGVARGRVNEASISIISFANRHQRPEGGQLVVARATLDDDFDALRGGVQGLKPAALRNVGGAAGTAPYTRDTEETLKGLMAALRSASEAYHPKLREWKDYQSALHSYAALLRSTEVSYSAVAAATKPSLGMADPYQLFAAAGDVRRYALQIKKILQG